MAAAESLALIGDYAAAAPFAWRDGERVTHAEALAAMRALADALATGRDTINLCRDRYLFTVAWAAVCWAGGTNLLPHGVADGVLERLQRDYPEAATLDDRDVRAALGAARHAPPAMPTIAADHRAAVVFTSGSTGQPRPHDKYFGDLVSATRLYQQRFFGRGPVEHAVATVPAPHMYGLETSVLPALVCAQPFAAERPFTPWAIAAALARLPAPRLLITTPTHLRACLEAGTAMPALARVLSATAPLDLGLAQAVEDRWQTRVFEIFGSTEFGSIATRRTVCEDWRLHDGVTLAECGPGRWQVSAPHLREAVALSDDIERVGARGFRFIGRAASMLKVAGKRMSVEALTHHLLAIDGVEDAAVLAPEAHENERRPAALVVAPSVDERTIGAALARSVDAVFLPRPLLRVAELPRNALGKIARRDLEHALAAARGRSRYGAAS